MNVQVTIRQKINRPVSEVFDAVIDPVKLSSYFTTTASGPLRAGETVKWTWGDMSSDTIVEEVVENKSIVCRWEAYKVDYQTTCRFEFASKDNGATVVSVIENGWKDDQDGVDSALEHAGGWQHMLLCLKAWIEHGIDLR